ncbi:MAG: hypothetical protein ACRETQ_02990 [Gammaproteobacteria bacterium]
MNAIHVKILTVGSENVSIPVHALTGKKGMGRKFVGILVIAAAMGVLANCSLVATSIMVKVPPANNAEWNFSATETRAPVGTISLFINQTLIGSDDHRPANIKETYQGHAIQAVCPTLVIYNGSQTTCNVYVDGVMVVTLDF